MQPSFQKQYFLSVNGSNKIAAYIAETPAAPLAAVQIIHGMSETFDCYREFCDFLARRRILTCGHEQLGHGDSAETPDDYGYFGKPSSWRTLVADARQMTNLVQQRYPRIPYFLLGHSLGSFVARAYAVCHRESIRGVLLSGTSGSQPFIDKAVAAAKIACYFKGGRYRSRFINHLAFGNFNHRFEPAENPYAWLSRDPQKMDAHLKDARRNFIFTVSAFREVFRLLQYVNSLEWYCAYPKDLPTLLFSGAMDPIGRYGRGVAEIYKRLRQADAGDVTLKLYEDGRHEMLNEINRREVFEDLLAWLRLRL